MEAVEAVSAVVEATSAAVVAGASQAMVQKAVNKMFKQWPKQ
jgi:hypothetical protein